MAVISCRHFSGYKPCAKNSHCDQSCPSQDIVEENILLVHLGALGAVVRSTALLPALKRKHPRARIFWVTEKVALPLLQNQKLLDGAFSCDFESQIILQNYLFSHIYVLDKSLKATGFIKNLEYGKLLGFQSEDGVILPATPAAEELWQIGLDNHKKFHLNKKTENQLSAESLELIYLRDEYGLALSPEEESLAKQRRYLWSQENKKIVVGINTGCSPTIPYKKLSIEKHRELCKALESRQDLQVVLLGGREDSQRNQDIGQGFSSILSPTEKGLRDGLCSVSACDIVITGDSLGMHLAIAQKKWVLAWFGPTCAHEIELYGRGQKILSRVSCGPCWKRSCQKDRMCYDQVELTEILQGIDEGIRFWQQIWSSKQPSLATSSSAFPY